MQDTNWPEGKRIRTYGKSGPVVIVLHGGPAASGNAAPIAQGLADSFQVIEPWQRGGGETPLTVARHIADLHDLIVSRCANIRPAIIGESWGAMLALAYAAHHPENAGPLVLIGCGTFDKIARARMKETIENRMTDDMKQRLKSLPDAFPDPDERQREMYSIIRPLYLYDPIDTDNNSETEPFDMKAHKETWGDMLMLQEESVYPGKFTAIKSPVIMLHGAFDPHPGKMIYDGLKPFIPQLEYHEWEKCGHSPWEEKQVRDDFFEFMREWLLGKVE